MQPTDIYSIRAVYYAALALTIASLVVSLALAEFGFRRGVPSAIWISETVTPLVPLVLAIFIFIGPIWSFNP